MKFRDFSAVWEKQRDQLERKAGGGTLLSLAASGERKAPFTAGHMLKCGACPAPEPGLESEPASPVPQIWVSELKMTKK